MKFILDIIINWVIPVILAGLLSLISYYIKKVFSKFNDLESGLNTLTNTTLSNDLVIMWSLLQNMTEQVISLKHCDDATMSCIEQLFAEYTKMNGNHGMQLRVDQCRRIANKK